MSVRVTDNGPKIKADTHSKGSLFLRLMLEGIDKSAMPKTPKNHGLLRTNFRKQVLGYHGSIRWGQKYAIYQETKRFRKYTTGGTGPHFAENAVRKEVGRSNQYAKQSGLI